MAKAILFAADPGADYYVRVFVDETTSVAESLQEGTGDGVGFYYIEDTDLVSAGLTAAGNFLYKIFSGATPSTSANDPFMTSGLVRWDGQKALDSGSLLSVSLAQERQEIAEPNEISTPGGLDDEHLPAKLRRNQGETIASVDASMVGPVDGGNVTLSAIGTNANPVTIPGLGTFGIAECIEFDIDAGANITSQSVEISFQYTTSAGTQLWISRTYFIKKRLAYVPLNGLL